jgi:hypothetical protein
MFRLITKSSSGITHTNSKLDIAGLNTDPYFTTAGCVLKSRYPQLMYVRNFHEEN